MDKTLSCQCGKFQGVVQDFESLHGNRFVCMCDDCQAYAVYLGQPESILDRNGGTEILPVPPALLKIVSGHEHLKCLRPFADDGIHRWYTGCCNSPIANTIPPKLGYIGLFVRALKNTAPERDLGPVLARCFASYGIPPLPEGSHPRMPFKAILMTIRLILRVNLRRIKRPNPFFDPKTDEPVVVPQVFSAEELDGLMKRTTAWREEKTRAMRI